MVKLHPCPICKKLTDNEKYRPFCSKRCADVDLGHWFNGDYTIAADDCSQAAKPQTSDTELNQEDTTSVTKF